MSVTLYDLAGADPDLRFSPYCWRTRFALRHKGVPFETVPWHFTQTDRLAFSGQAKVPVIVDGEHTVSDSWAIACYLEEQYPERPSLFGGGTGLAHVRFINAWADSVLQPAIARLIVRDVLDVLRPEDQHYFRHSREIAFGQTLEEVVRQRDEKVQDFRKSLQPIRLVLRQQRWLGGTSPDYADYAVLGSLQWPRCTSRFSLFEADDPVLAWRDRGFALFDGMAAEAPSV